MGKGVDIDEKCKGNDGKRKKQNGNPVYGNLSLAVMLTACGSGEKIYEDDRIKATVTESNGQLDLSVRIRSSTAPMREAVRKNLTEGGTLP